MASSKTGWVDETVPIAKLNLDLQNPRVPKHIKDLKDESKILEYLISKEQVERIAESIAHNGYHKSVVSIVCKEGDKLVVLDGNRRLAACLLLQNPALAPSEHRKPFETLSKLANKSDFAAVKVTVAPSRKEAEREIWDIHVNSLLKPWQVLQKLRMYRNLIAEGELDVSEAATQYQLSVAKFKAELAKLHFFEVLSKDAPQSEEVLLDSGFNKIDRLILGKHGKSFLGYEVTDKGEITTADPADHAAKLKALAPYITTPSKVSPQATQDWLLSNVFNKIDPGKFAQASSSAKSKPKPKKPKSKTHPKCFVIMPLAGLDAVYSTVQQAWWDVFGKKAKIFNQQDDKQKGAKELIDQKILKNISSSDVVVGILSLGEKERLLFDAVPESKRNAVFAKAFPINPNVALEIGYAARASTIENDSLHDYFLIADSKGKHSAFDFVTARCFDLGHRDIISYTEDNLDALKSELTKAFSQFKQDHLL